MSTCWEIKSSLTLEEEQFCDWTHMDSAFFRGHGKVRMHTSVYLQPAEFSTNALFFNVKNLEANGLKNCVCIKSSFALIRNKILLFKFVVKDALLHMGCLLYALLWAHSKASVLLT